MVSKSFNNSGNSQAYNAKIFVRGHRIQRKIQLSDKTIGRRFYVLLRIPVSESKVDLYIQILVFSPRSNKKNSGYHGFMPVAVSRWIPNEGHRGLGGRPHLKGRTRVHWGSTKPCQGFTLRGPIRWHVNSFQCCEKANNKTNRDIENISISRQEKQSKS